ncbi:hypothetical protein [Algiphilus sp.]|nr:hypothetical protein [Algiphilus sp.]
MSTLIALNRFHVRRGSEAGGNRNPCRDAPHFGGFAVTRELAA